MRSVATRARPRARSITLRSASPDRGRRSRSSHICMRCLLCILGVGFLSAAVIEGAWVELGDVGATRAPHRGVSVYSVTRVTRLPRPAALLILFYTRVASHSVSQQAKDTARGTR